MYKSIITNSRGEDLCFNIFINFKILLIRAPRTAFPKFTKNVELIPQYYKIRIPTPDSNKVTTP